MNDIVNLTRRSFLKGSAGLAGSAPPFADFCAPGAVANRASTASNSASMPA